MPGILEPLVHISVHMSLTPVDKFVDSTREKLVI
jgi:hypothetical protein